MPTVNIHKAKSELSRLVAAIESGAESEIIIARNGKPAARLTPLEKKASGPRIGVLQIDVDVPPSNPRADAEIAALFEGRPAKRERRSAGRRVSSK